MKLKTLLFALFIVASYAANSQNLNPVEDTVGLKKSVFDLQIGLIGAWAAYEHHIAPKTTMRYDLGIYSDHWMSGDKLTDFIMRSQISAETRFYHHPISGLNKGSNVTGIEGNFLAFRLLYQTGVGVAISNNTERSKFYPSYISIMPRYGIRRMITENFHYELAFGLGYGNVVSLPVESSFTNHFVDYNIHIRIGYTF